MDRPRVLCAAGVDAGHVYAAGVDDEGHEAHAGGAPTRGVAGHVDGPRAIRRGVHESLREGHGDLFLRKDARRILCDRPEGFSL